MSTDFYLLDELLTDEARAVRDRVRAFVDADLLPVINDYWERAEFPFELVPKLAALGVVGGTIEGYGCPGLSPLAAGLVAHGAGPRRRQHQHVLRRAVRPGHGLDLPARLRGAEAALAAGHGAAGADRRLRAHRARTTARTRSRWRPRARRDGDDYVLNGAKRWIGNASFADVVVVWARDDDDGAGQGLRRREGHDGHPDGYTAE